jgi:hypothetical protein
MSDFGSTLKLFAKAKIGGALPLDDIEAVKHQIVATVDAVRRRNANREQTTHCAIGRLVFASTVDDAEPKPLPFAKVELWDRDFGSPNDYLGEAVTDAVGRFAITYDPSDAGSLDSPDLELRVYDRYAGQDRLLLVFEGDKDVTEKRYDFGDIPVAYYEYHPDIPLPHVLTLTCGREKFDAMPQAYEIGRKMAMAQIASRVLGIRLRHYAISRNGCLEDIQDDYRGKTTYAPPVGLGPDASDDERFIDKLLNGACPCTFTRDEAGRLHIVRNWDAYAMDGKHYLPNVHAVFDYDGEVLTPRSITIQARKDDARAPHSPLDEPKTWRPGEDGWAHARHVLDCNNYMHTQVANHLARGHFNVEQFALAAFRNFRSSPLRDLLFPHLKEVMVINVEGERAIFGPEGLITKNGALTEVSLVEAIRDHACIDWYGFRPRAPLTTGHHFAHVANLYWGVLTKHVDLFFASNLDAILATWNEAVAFSQDLVAHSLRCVPLALPEGLVEHDESEVAKPDAPRIEVDGVLRVVTPVVTEASPNERELAQLAHACVYAIYHATFFHTWINDTSDVLEPSYAQYNPTDRSSAKELTDHISLNLALSQTRYGLIMRNEDGDIPQALIDALDVNADAFAQHGFDVRRIRSRINI